MTQGRWRAIARLVALLALSLAAATASAQMAFTVVELNCENLFDTQHDTLKNDYDFLPESSYRWTRYRYWEKLNKIGQELTACGTDSAGWSLPDLIGLCEVENDTVLRDLTKRSLLRKARYEYVMTDSPDLRGIDVALLYSPMSFGFINSRSFRVEPVAGMKPTRDILYVSGRVLSDDTLHVFVVHAPSRLGGERRSRKFRLRVMERLCQAIDSVRSLSPEAMVLVMGDFNDYVDGPSLEYLYARGLRNVSKDARGGNGARGTYRYHGKWGSLDQIVVSPSLARKVAGCRIGDAPFLLEDDTKYGGVKPFRFFLGPRYIGGYSDHLPLILKLNI